MLMLALSLSRGQALANAIGVGNLFASQNLD